MRRSKNNQIRPLEPVSLVVLNQNHSSIAEQYRILRSNIKFSTKQLLFKTMMVTSSVGGEGKSTTAANLAIIFAETGQKILLVDCDMRRPTVDKTFQLSNFLGLSNVLIDHSLRLEEVIKYSGVPNLDILPSGEVPPDPSAMLSSERFNRMLDRLKNMYDLIILDTPPVLLVSDAQILSSKTDGVLMVARKDSSKKADFLAAKEQLMRAEANILGAVYKVDDLLDDKDYYRYGDF